MNEKSLMKQSSLDLSKAFNLEESTQRVKDYARWTTVGMIACGIELLWVKKNLKHGEWEDWIKDELKWHPNTVRYLINAAKLYGDEQGLRLNHKQVLAAEKDKIAGLYSNPQLAVDLATNLTPAQVWGHQPHQLTSGDNWLRVYNVWNFAFRDLSLGEEWAGNIPGQIAMNVIHYYTKEGDLVVDPMAGGGSTVDACKKLNRRCLAYDIEPLEEKGIKYNDVRKGGFPDKCNGCDLIFLDPPYYKINRPLYSEDSVSALEIDEFRGFVKKLARDCFTTVKDDGFVSFLIQNYYIKFASLDGYLDLAREAIVYFEDAGFKMVNRISCPQSSEVYSASDVELAKKQRGMLNLLRDLTVFQKATMYSKRQQLKALGDV